MPGKYSYPILQYGNRGSKELWLGQGHAARKWQSQALNLDRLALGPTFSPPPQRPSHTSLGRTHT